MLTIARGALTLSNWNADDYKSLATYANNINIWNNLRDALPHPYTEKDAMSYIDFASSQPNMFAIDIDGEAVGSIGYFPLSDVERVSAELGYFIGEPFWSKGIMTDVLKTLVEHVFSTTEIVRLFATPFGFNSASFRVLEKVGFTKLTVLHKAAIKNGKLIDMCYYELVKV